MSDAVQYPRDHNLRFMYYPEEAFWHKARMNLNFLGKLVHDYIPAGSLIVDPMGGAGSTLFPVSIGYRVITGDIENNEEAPWCRVMQDSLEQIVSQSLFAGQGLICHWDAGRLPLPSGKIPAILMSPPYYDIFSDWNRSSGLALSSKYRGPNGQCYGFSDRQIGNIHVYEDYLSAMAEIYRECWRVLEPGGRLIVVVGDRVKNGKVVPITQDTYTMLEAMGFDPQKAEERQTIPTQWRRIHQSKDKNYPGIDTETALIFMKPWIYHCPGRTMFLIEGPNPITSPGLQLLEKQIAYAWTRSKSVYLLNRYGAAYQPPNERNKFDYFGPELTGPGRGKARTRREFAYRVVRNLVEMNKLRSGEKVELHVTGMFAPYLKQRLETFGIEATIPTAHRNMGQKLTWYTRRLNDES